MNESNEAYNILWCEQRHTALDKHIDGFEDKVDRRMSSLENKFWGIILLLMTNLAGITTLLVTGG